MNGMNQNRMQSNVRPCTQGGRCNKMSQVQNCNRMDRCDEKSHMQRHDRMGRCDEKSEDRCHKDCCDKSMQSDQWSNKTCEEKNAFCQAHNGIKSIEHVDYMGPTMAYVPWQRWQEIYDMEKGFCKGTIFGDLDKPFKGGLI